MLRRIRGVTLKVREKSEKIRKELGVDDINENVRETQMRWYGYVMRTDEANPVKKVMNMDIEGIRPRGRSSKRWKDNVNKDMEHFQVRAKDTEDRHLWRRKTKEADPAEQGETRHYRERERERERYFSAI